MTAATVHVIGAGLAGLSASVALVQAGAKVRLYEAALRAGGRCRSYHDTQLDRTIDNGNHLVLSGNRAVMRYLDAVGARGRLAGPRYAEFAFCDVRAGTRWMVRANDGPVPWWIARPERRVPDTHATDYFGLARLVTASPGATVGDIIKTSGRLWDRLIEPVLLAALNVPAATGSARLAGRVIAASLARGGRASRPLIATPSLDAAFVDPALAMLARNGAEVRFGARLRRIDVEGNRAVAIDFGTGAEPLDTGRLVLAVPAWVAAALLPGLIVPDAHSAIVNAHFLATAPAGTPRMTGVIGGTAEWIFAFDDRISVTISGANDLVDDDREVLAKRIWADVAAALDLPETLPRWQIVKERRATFAATPDQDARRPDAATYWRNVVLAGDWTQTGLPATIEGAIQSGEVAARLASARQ